MNMSQISRWFNPRTWPLGVRLSGVTILLLIAALTGITFTAAQTIQTSLTEEIGDTFVTEASSLSQTVVSFLVNKIDQLQAITLVDDVKIALAERNAGYSGSSADIQAQIEALDAQWATAADDDPLIRQTIASDPNVNPMVWLLVDFAETFEDHVEIFITDRYGATVAATNRTSDYYQADEEWWQKAWNEGQGAIFISNLVFDKSSGRTGLQLAVPIFDEENGEVIGIIRSTLVVERMFHLLEVVKIGQTGYAILFDSNGKVLFDPKARDVESSSALPIELRQEFVTEESHFNITLDNHGRQLIVSHFPFNQVYAPQLGDQTFEEQATAAITKLGWVIVIRQETEEAFAAIDETMQNILIAALVAVGLAALVMAFTGRAITRPLAALSAAAGEIGAGNLAAPLPPAGPDEVGRLTAIFGTMAGRLRETLTGLEQKIAARTHGLELAAEVGQRLSTVRDLDALLAQSVELIQHSFSLYYTQIYLTGSAGRSLVLRAGSGSVGKQLLRRGHRLPVGPGSINGVAAGDKRAVIVSDTTQSATFLPNPLLPNTKSEMAVPLLIGERVVGVLNLQHDEANSLTEENLATFEALAGQLAIAIENAHLFVETEQARAKTEAYARTLAGQGWDEFLNAIDRGERLGFSYAQDTLNPLNEPLENTANEQALVVPVAVSGQPIGAIQLEAEPERAWTASEAELVSVVAQQVSQQIENLRLLVQANQYRTEAEAAARRTTRAGWAEYINSLGATSPGFIYDLNEVTPLNGESNNNQTTLSRPIDVRGEIIGELAIADIEQLDDEATELLAIVAEQLSDQIESARLLEETERGRQQQEQAAQRLQKEEERFRTVADFTYDWEYWINPDGFYEYVSPSCQRITGYTVDQFMQDPHLIETIIHPDDQAIFADHMHDYHEEANSDIGTARFRIIAKEGQERWIDHICQPVYSANGTMLGRRASQRDITERKQAEEAVAKRAAELQTVAEVSSKTATILDAKALLQTVADEAKERFTLYHVHIYLLDEAGENLVLAAGAGETGRKMVAQGWQIPLDREQSLVAQAARTQQGVIVNDVYEDPHFLPNELLPDTRSEMAVPLVMGERAIGVLDVQSDRVDRFTQEDVSIKTTLAGQIASALENARLFEQVEQGLQQTNLRLKVNQALAGMYTEVEVLDTLIQQADIYRQSRIAIYTFDVEAGEKVMILRREETFDSGITPVKIGTTFVLSRFPLFNLITNKPVILNNFHDERVDPASLEVLNQLGYLSLCIFPLTARNDHLGFFLAASKEEDYFDKHKQYLYQTLAEQGAIALHAARLKEETERSNRELAVRTRELEASQQVTFAASETNDPDELLGIVVNLIRDQFDLYHAQVYIVDEEKQAAVLRESTGYAGRQLLKRKHQIPLNSPALVTRAINSGEPVLVADVNQVKDWLPNELLPYTQAELVIPLKIDDQVLGALDVQSRSTNQLTERSMALFRTMADQVTFLFENSELLARITEQAENLRESQMRLGLLIQQSPVAVIEWNTEFEVVAWNPAAEQIFGYSQEEAMGRHPAGLIAPEDAKSVVDQVWTNLTSQQGGTRSTHDNNTKDGRLITCEWYDTTLVDQNGQVIGVASLVVDITERKQAEEETRIRFEVSQALATAQTEEQVLDALIEQAELYREAGVFIQLFEQEAEEQTVVVRRVDALESGITLFPQGTRFAVSEFSMMQLLTAHEAFVTSNLQVDERADAASRETARQLGTKSMAIVPITAGNVWLGAIVALTTREGYFDGHRLKLYQTLAEQGSAALHTARLNAERQQLLRQTQTLYQISARINEQTGLEETLQVLAQRINEELHYDNSWVALFDESSNTLVGMAGAGLTMTEEIIKETACIETEKTNLVVIAYETGQPVVINDPYNDERIAAVPDQIKDSIGKALVIPIISGGNVLGVIAISRQAADAPDISETDVSLLKAIANQAAVAIERARLFEEIQQTAERLREVDRLKSEFLANMSHELRTPLNSIIGYSEMMLLGISGDMPEEITEDIQAIYDNGKHLLHVISDILDLAKIEAGRLNLSLEEVHVDSLLDEVKVNNAGLFMNKPVEMVIAVEKNLPMIEADPIRINQILNNLISNAAKFTPEGKVTVSAHRDNDWIALTVEDTGVGMSEEDLHKIFDKFMQVDGSFTRRTEGTGLGLAITRHLIHMHRGEIDVRSELDKGTTFVVRLPLKRTEPDEELVEMAMAA